MQPQRLPFDANRIRVSGAVSDTGNGTIFPLEINANGGLDVNLVGSTGTGSFNLTQVGGANISLGQKVMATSLPVTLASDQSALSISQSGTWNINNLSGTVSLPTGASTSALQGTGNTSLSSIDSKTPALGQALAAGSVPIVLTVSQLSTLTPISNITNYALETGGNLATLAGTISASKVNSNVTQATAANLNATVVGTGTFAVQATQSGTWNVGLSAGSNAIGSITNTSFGVTQSTASNLNATVVGTGSFAVQAAATLSAETTKVIGVVRNADGSGNLLTSTSNALDVNLKGNPLVTSPLVGQSKIASSGTAVNLNGGTTQPLTNGIIITAPSGNTAPIAVGGSGVNNTSGGTGNGYQLAAGASISFAIANTNDIWINGTSGDYVSWAGS